MRDFFDEAELDTLGRAKEELKRVDHLIYVSLKYSRTVDVFRTVLERMISTGTMIIQLLLESAKDKGKLDELDKNLAIRCEQVFKVYPEEDQVKEFVEFYVYLRHLMLLEYSASNEYRRHVTMTAVDGDKEIPIKIETVTEYYHRIRDYFNHFVEKVC